MQGVHGRPAHGNGGEPGRILGRVLGTGVGEVRVEETAAIREPGRPDVGVRSVLDEKAHGLDVRGVCRPPEGCRAGEVDTHAAGIVGGVPDVCGRPLVGIRARVEQEAHEFEVAGLLLAEGLGLGIPGAQRPLDVECGEKRSRAVIADEVGVRAPFKQIPPEVVVAVDDGHQKRGGLVAFRGPVDVLASVEQQRGRGAMALSSRIVQCAETTLLADLLGGGQSLYRQLLRFFRRRGRLFGLGPAGCCRSLGRVGGLAGLCALGRALLCPGGHHRRCGRLGDFLLLFRLLGRGPHPGPLPLLGAQGLVDGLVVLHPRSKGDVGPRVQQGAHCGVRTAHGSEHQRGPLGEAVPRVHVAAVCGQRVDHVARVGVGREVHRGHTGGGIGVGIRAGFQDQSHNLGVAAPAREVQRRVRTEAGPGTHGCSRIQEGPCDVHIVVARGPMERGHPVALGRVDVRTLPEQSTHRFQIAAFGRIGDRRFNGYARPHRNDDRSECEEPDNLALRTRPPDRGPVQPACRHHSPS